MVWYKNLVNNFNLSTDEDQHDEEFCTKYILKYPVWPSGEQFRYYLNNQNNYDNDLF